MFLSFFSIVLLKSITPFTWKLLPDPQKQSLNILGYKYISNQDTGVMFLAVGFLGNNAAIKRIMTCAKCRTCRHWWKHGKAKKTLNPCKLSFVVHMSYEKRGISALVYTGVKRKVIRISFTYLTGRICNNSPVGNGFKLYLFKLLCSTCLTQCSLRIPDAYCFVLSSISKTIFPLIHVLMQRNALPIQDLRMVAKILCLLSSSSSVNDRWLKCLRNRGVTGFLPPPGGPIDATKLISTSSRKVPKTENKMLWARGIPVWFCFSSSQRF